MAGTLTISTLSDGTNSTSATNCIQGSAKAWVNFNGTLSGTITPRASYNVNSVTKNGTGDYTINFTTALTDANYSMAGMARSAGRMVCIGAAPTTSGLRVYTANDAGNLEDLDTVTVVFFR